MRKGSKQTKEAIEKNRIAHIGKSVWNKGLKGELYKKHFSAGFRGTFKNGHKPWHAGIKVPKRSGENCHLWKGGITTENHKIRDSLEMNIWRKAVFERDNYTCVWCRSRNGNGKKIIIHADHIKPFAYFPELRFAIDNGRTLCKPCHKTTDTFGTKARKYAKI